jgi:hypothetical protein
MNQTMTPRPPARTVRRRRAAATRIVRRAVIAAGAACLAAGALIGTTGASAAGAIPARPVPVQGELLGVSASSATNAWAVGFRFGSQTNRTLTEHWNGKSWTRVNSLNPGGVGHQAGLFGVAALSENNAWAVGFFSDGTVNHALIEHWNGTAWKVFKAPVQGCEPGDALSSVTAISPSDVWAAGEVTNCLTLEPTPEAFHWNGKAWHQVAPPNPGNFLGGEILGVDAASAHNLWAVGEYPDDPSNPIPSKTLTAHWNGTKWRSLTSPNPAGSMQPNQLKGVAVTSASDAWAVGSSLLQFPHAPVTVTLRWNGKAWKRVASPHPAHGNGDELSGIAALSASDAFAVGDFRDAKNRSRTLILRWNGRSWKVMPSPTPPAPAKESGLSGIAATSANNAWAVGTYFLSNDDKVIILHWNGKSWRRQL